MEKNYQIFRRVFDQKDLKNPLDINVVDLLINRAEGCQLDIIVEPKDEFEREKVKKGEVLAERFALNYGPRGNSSYMYRVFIENPRDEKIYHLDNAFDDKYFKCVISHGLPSIWREADKIMERYTFKGAPEEIFKEFKARGYSFLEWMVAEDKEERIEKVKQHLKKHNISYFGLTD